MAWGLGSGLGGKGVLVTSAAGGVGRPTAQAFASAGARVVAVDLRRSAADEVVAGLDADGHVAVGMDLTDLDAQKALVDRAVDERHAAGARRRPRGDRRGRGLRGRQARWVRQRRNPQRQRRPADVLSVGTRRRRRVSQASQTLAPDPCSGESDPPPSGNPNSMSVIRRRPQSASTPDRMAPLAPHSSLRPGAGPRLEPEPECTLRGVQRQARSVTGRTSRNAEQGCRPPQPRSRCDIGHIGVVCCWSGAESLSGQAADLRFWRDTRVRSRQEPVGEPIWTHCSHTTVGGLSHPYCIVVNSHQHVTRRPVVRPVGDNPENVERR